MRDCTIRIAKTMALISCAVTGQLICVSVFANVKNRFSHDATHICSSPGVFKCSNDKAQFSYCNDPKFSD